MSNSLSVTIWSLLLAVFSFYFARNLSRMRVRIENEDPWEHGKYPPRKTDVQLPPGLLGRLLTSLPSNASTTAPAILSYYQLRA